MRIGIAIKILAHTYGPDQMLYTPEMIVNEHKDVLKNKGHVYFSTNLPVNGKRVPFLKELILYDPAGSVCYRCNVLSVTTGKTNTNYPADADRFSPAIFNEPKKTWFLIDKIEPVSVSELDNPVLSDDDPKTVRDVMSASSDKRFPRFFYKI